MRDRKRGNGTGLPGLLAVAVGGVVGWGLAASGLAAAGLGALALGVLGALALGLGRATPRPTSLAGFVREAQGDPDHPLAPLAADIEALVARVDGHGQAIRAVVRRLQEHATLVAWVIDTLNHAVGEARESLATMQRAAGRVEEHAGEVFAASQKGVSFLDTMGGSTEELFQGAESLNRSVEDATASVIQIHGALSGVQQGVALLSDASDRTTDFIAQVGRAMGSIREGTDQSLELARGVEAYARRGREVVVRAGAGIDAIRRSSRSMVQSVEGLTRQSQEVEGVLGIITDVAEETALLSLNAAILAAQAGEKGAAFAVVADQIRSLARRTRESTKHIEGLVRGIQANIAETNAGLGASLAAVEEGDALGREAVHQLELIEGSVAESLTRARRIAEAAQGQDEKSRAMVSAAGEVNESLHHVAENLGQSLVEMDRIQALIQALSALSQSVRAATEEHRRTGWKTLELMASFTTQVEGIHGLVDGQRDTSNRLEAALAQVADSGDSTGESLETIHAIVNELVAQSDGLREEVRALLPVPEEESGDA